ncbi:MAG: DNA mismatch repair protein MutS [Prevotellaceae bacterium]|jgi:DNA mismatch repair protein MutS|nr:DNA mismatch repair protein MutS [Prevotellaceae bacterium]
MLKKENSQNKTVAETPLMKQYHGIKSKHPDALLLFRVGDFYETFGSDAIKTSEILGITLTKRANGAASHIDLAGFPHHALDTYLPKLVRAGQRVAICDQLEDPKNAKTIVKRGITELVTPGIAFNANILEHRENNFLACIHIAKTTIGIAFLDISTGEFYVAEGQPNYIDKLLNNFMPKEIVYQKGKDAFFNEHFGQKYYTYKIDEWAFAQDPTREKLLQQFQTTSLKGFGIDELMNGQIAAGAILYYLELTQHDRLAHISSISRIEEDHYVWLDRFTIRNLELFQANGENAKSLLNIIDKTISPMGARLLKRWLALPLKEVKSINDRLSLVEYLIDNPEIRENLRTSVYEIGDIERIISRTSAGRVSPKETVHLKISLKACAEIKHICLSSSNETLRQIGDRLNPCTEICDRIEREIVPEPPHLLAKGNVVADGVNEELDDLRNILLKSKEILAEIQQRESEQTGISSLKINFNNVFGYYIEVRNTHKDKVPSTWIRKQTLVGAERYITEELKVYEDKILGAEERILVVEQQIFNNLLLALIEYVVPVQLNASLIGQLDCLLSFAELAIHSNYCKPAVNNSNSIDIRQGRHPVVEKLLPAGEEYIANDLLLDRDNQQIIIITGPNMSGKSAILRQTALIVLLAQIGSFVPAASASIGVVDKIFTRVGASDNISQGESTFMVEMHETASILNNISDRSLILLDEIGRGTSTYDGISIAWALVEYIHEHPTSKAKTLFATHYHELNEMENSFVRIKNFNVTVKELNNKVIFLRKLMPGGVAHSFGIHVAQMAGMPKSVVSRATEILKEMEKSHNALEKPVANLATHREGYQLTFFQLDDPVLKDIRDKLKKIDVDNLTPIEALNKLNEIKRITGF